MAHIKVNNFCNVNTCEDSKAYCRQAQGGYEVQPQVTIPMFRAALSVEDAEALAKALLEAVEEAKVQGTGFVRHDCR